MWITRKPSTTVKNETHMSDCHRHCNYYQYYRAAVVVAVYIWYTESTTVPYMRTSLSSLQDDTSRAQYTLHPTNHHFHIVRTNVVYHYYYIALLQQLLLPLLLLLLLYQTRLLHLTPGVNAYLFLQLLCLISRLDAYFCLRMETHSWRWKSRHLTAESWHHNKIVT